MKTFVLKSIEPAFIQEELSQIGFDESYIDCAKNKYKYKNIKIFALSPAQANILKQTALSCGADCATHREVITGNIEKSDVILGGSVAELEKIAEKLKSQPFNLPLLREKILNHLQQSRHNKTKLVGILNITPDSFSDGGMYFEPLKAQKHLIQMIEDGADMIDIGAESTRPYSAEISPKEQIERLKPIIEFIQKEKIKTSISVDTRSSEVADYVLNNGVSIINDVSGFDYDKNMPDIIAQYNAGIIIQHSKGTPANMQDSPQYDNIIDEIYTSLKEKIEFASSKGIKNIIIDPGIGFGKTRENNFEILERITEFYSLNCPIMIGLSRKSLLGINEDNNELKDTLSAALSYPLIKKHIDYLRVHNVRLHKNIIQLA